jgi:hypothetical protein
VPVVFIVCGVKPPFVGAGVVSDSIVEVSVETPVAEVVEVIVDIVGFVANVVEVVGLVLYLSEMKQCVYMNSQHVLYSHIIVGYISHHFCRIFKIFNL